MPHVTIAPYNANTPTVVANAAKATALFTLRLCPPDAATRASSQRRYSLAAGLA